MSFTTPAPRAFPTPRVPVTLAALLLAADLLTVPGGELAAQTRYTVVEEPGGTAVGVAVIINAGSAWEMRSEAGLTYLAARSVLEGLRPELDPLGARTAVECDPVGIRFTLSVPAATWEAATELYLDAIFDARIDHAAVERARREVLTEAALAEESLSTAIRTALARAEFGENDRWARPGCGSAATIAALSSGDVRRLAETRFTPYRATAAVAGPVGQTAARALLSRYLPDSELPVLVAAPAGAPAGQTRTIEQNAVTAWIGIAFSFPRTADLEALRLLAYQLARDVAPAPTRPEIYDATVEISQHGGGGALVVYLVTAPTHAREWIDRVRRIARAAAESELGEPAFDALRHRYAGVRLLELDSPEERARDAALQLFFEHTYTPPQQRIAALTPAALRAAAALLGEPSVALLGPR